MNYDIKLVFTPLFDEIKEVVRFSANWTLCDEHDSDVYVWDNVGVLKLPEKTV